MLVDMMAQISRFTGHNCRPASSRKPLPSASTSPAICPSTRRTWTCCTISSPSWALRWSAPAVHFYIFPKALEEDANAFLPQAREFDLLLVPSDTFGVKAMSALLLHRHREGEAQSARTGKAGRSLSMIVR